MNLEDIKKIAKSHGIKVGKMKKNEIVRAIQLAEGNEECFGTEKKASCGQSDCLWIHDC
jgi:hypothetical protein